MAVTTRPAGIPVLYESDSGDPTASDDAATLGVRAGYYWHNLATGDFFICRDPATSAAKWLRVSGAGGQSLTWSTLPGVPGTFPPSTHSHAIADVTSLQTTLNGKAASSHSHAIADVTNLQTTLDGKQASSAVLALLAAWSSGAGTDPLDVPRNVELGSAAWINWQDLPARLFGSAVAVARVLLPADAGRVLVVTAAVPVTLPAAATAGDGFAVWIKNRSGGAINITPAGTDQLDGVAASLSLPNGTARLIVRSGAASFESV